MGKDLRDCVEFGGAHLPLEVTPAPKSTQSPQSNTANTRIVCGEIQDSKEVSEFTPADSKNASNPRTISESTLSHSYSTSKYRTLDSHSPSESIRHASRDISNFRPQYDKVLESYPHANLESKADSELILAVGHSSTAIKIKSREAPESRQLSGVQKSETRRAVVSRRRFLARSGNSEALPLIAEKKKRSFILFGAKGSGEGINPFSFCDTRFKESRESKEVKSGDSKKADSESEILKIQESKKLELLKP